PLTFERENVQPRFLRRLRVAVFSQTHEQLGSKDMNTVWAQTAMDSPDCPVEAARSYMKGRFGEKHVSYDPSDPEANKLAVSGGFDVVGPRMLSGPGWVNARKAGILPAGQVTPSPKVWTGEDNPN